MITLRHYGRSHPILTVAMTHHNLQQVTCYACNKISRLQTIAACLHHTWSYKNPIAMQQDILESL
jgi:hypothetical protein